MQEEHLVLLMQLIEREGNLENLIREGISYSDIVILLNYLKENDYINYNDSKFCITDTGKQFFSRLNNNLNRVASSTIISPQNNYLIEKKSIYEIYLPQNINSL